MENENKKTPEPYTPEGTPRPPQVIDPANDRQPSSPVEEEKRKEKQKIETPKKEKPHLLGDDTQISDETTI